MDPARRHRYLQLLGIDVWQLREADGRRAPRAAAQVEVRDAAVDQAPPAARRPAATPAAPRRSPAPAMPAPALSAAAAPVVAVPAASAAALAELPADWAGLRERVRDCSACKLCATRSNTVFGVGPEDAPLMVVGEGPGADEDAQGEPFVGRAGKLLDEMLRAIGRSRRDNVFIANVVKCRPPGNRDPEADEVEACRPYLDRQIELLKPRLIVALGRVAAQRLLSTDAPLSKLRGPLYRYGPQQTPVFVTYHPAYLLRSPREKAKSWEDLKQIHRHLAPPAP